MSHDNPPAGDGRTIYLVACVKSKQDQPAPARELYTSTWFQWARQFVESSGSPWYVLSALYGLLEPDDVVAPYDRTLKHMSAAERRCWGERVRRQLESVDIGGKRVVLLAGRAYREPIVDYLRDRASSVDIPMEHLSQGRQLQWLGERVRRFLSSEPGEIDSPRATEISAGDSAPAAIRDALLEFGSRIDHETMVPALEAGASRLVVEDAYAFLLATCLDRGTRAEIIWTIPLWLRRQWGHLDPHRIRSMSDGDIAEAIEELPKRPRYKGAAVVTIRELTRIVVDEYAADARAFWKGRSATEFQSTLERIPGVGPGIASMAVQLVERLFPGEFREGPTAGLDIKADVHTRRVLYRLGIAPQISDRAALDAARRLLPEYPGRLDAPLWYIGLTWCHARGPECSKCPVTAVCAKQGVGAASAHSGPMHRQPAEQHQDARPRGRPGGRYAPLREYLQQQRSAQIRVALSFKEIEEILGRPLPDSAYRYRPWWANATRTPASPQGDAWSSAGYQVTQVSLAGRTVEFTRRQ